MALGRLGPHASLHVGAIVTLLQDRDVHVRRAAVVALGQMGGGASLHAAAMHRRSMLWGRRGAAAQRRPRCATGAVRRPRCSTAQHGRSMLRGRRGVEVKGTERGKG